MNTDFLCKCGHRYGEHSFAQTEIICLVPVDVETPVYCICNKFTGDNLATLERLNEQG
jgi:hypothetical protein